LVRNGPLQNKREMKRLRRQVGQFLYISICRRRLIFFGDFFKLTTRKTIVLKIVDKELDFFLF
jgi:hypothetical protein